MKNNKKYKKFISLFFLLFLILSIEGLTYSATKTNKNVVSVSESIISTTESTVTNFPNKEETTRKPHGRAMKGAVYQDEWNDHYRVIEAEGGGYARDKSVGVAGNDENLKGVLAGVAGDGGWKVVVNGSENNTEIKEIDKKQEENVSEGNFWDKFVDFFKYKKHQTNKKISNKYLDIDMPNLPITLTFYDGSKVEIVSVDNKIEKHTDGRCTGQIYYRIKKLINGWFLESNYRIRLMDNNNFVPDGYNQSPNFNNINVGEVAEGCIHYSNIPYSDTYRLVVEIK